MPSARTKPKAASLALTGELNIYEAARLKTMLFERLNASKSLEIDLSGVTELDSAGVQLMLLLQREATASDKPLQWTKHSPAVSQVLSLLNLGNSLGDPVSIVWS